MRLERTCRGAAGNRVHHRGFNFEEAVIGHVVADRLDDPAARSEGEARLLVHDQVKVTHAVLLLLVGQPVELFRQGAQRLGEQADFRTLHGQFAGLGTEDRADGTDDVANVPALEGGVGFFADLIARDVQLNAAGYIRNGDECCLAHDALEHDTPGDLDFNGG